MQTKMQAIPSKKTQNPPLYKSKFLKEMQERGYIKQCTNHEDLDTILHKAEQNTANRVVAYVGFDCTAKSLHIGSLMQIMIMRLFQKCGHKPIILLGGATTKIGDPSDKDEARKILNDEVIEANKKSIATTFKKFLNFSSQISNSAILVDNLEWLENIKYLNFLREYGKYFSINRMLGFESIKKRLSRNSPLSFLEFNYNILQAYDFVELNKRYNCILQFGGSEQWGNIVSGIDLSHKILQQNLYGITTPLVTTSNGKKMGKTAEGAIWLDHSMLSPYDYWQYWRNTNDADLESFLKKYTEFTPQYCTELLQTQNVNDVKIILANEVTKICHGLEEAQKAAAISASIFSTNTTKIKSTNDNTNIENSFTTLHLTITEKHSKEGYSLYKLFVDSELAKSGNDAKRIIQQGGAKINSSIIKDPMHKIYPKHKEKLKLSSGKKLHQIVEFTKK